MRKGLLVTAALAALLSAVFASLASAADHRDSPTPTGNQGADITDFYVFRSPTTPENVVLIVNSHGFIAPVDNASASFDSNARFQIHVDNDGNLVDDLRIDIRKAGDSIIAEGLGNTFGVEVTPAGAEPIIREDGSRRLFAGLRDDPFFFDIPGFQAFLMNRETPVNGLRAADGGDPIDAFGGTNVLSIVLEVPVASLTGGSDANSGVVGLWVSSETSGGQRQDRAAQAIFNAGLIPPDPVVKEAVNQGSPSGDTAAYLDAVVGTIGFLRGVADQAIGGVQGGGPLGDVAPGALGAALVPDVVNVDFSQPVVFPNGRQLSDDAIDLTFGIVMNRGGAEGVSDGIDANDKVFLSAFPYMAEPHGEGDVGPITPPDTGDGGVLRPATSWALSAAFLAVALVLGGAAAFVTVRSRR